ncbi:hypothetical protein [Devosia pacifica]|nr:hypothetical protein [Devosia pacifica]
MRGSVRITVEMQETKELLMNPVVLRARAYCVPWLALERFEGSRDQFDRSYMGQPKVEGGTVVPFIETALFGTHGSKEVYVAMGMHGKADDMVNTMPLESYNAVWNFLAENRSKEIEKRTRLDDTLAPAFWPRSRFEHVVPDFDQAVIDGEISLNMVQGGLQLRGIGRSGSSVTLSGVRTNESAVEGDGTVVYDRAFRTTDPNGPLTFEVDESTGRPKIFAEMEAGGISVSLSNLELAKKTQAFAAMRQRYEGIDDEYIIDMLMDGLTIPDQALKQPFMVADKSVRFSQVKRYASDSGNLAESAVTGGAIIDLPLRVPKLNTGGTIIVVVECVPEQLFERQQDPFLHLQSQDDLPEFLRDYLDPEKVEIVTKAQIDTDHSAPDETFGYAPLNWKWTSQGPRIGGKFYRPEVDAAFDEERQRIWAIETEDPILSEDFYLVSDIHTKPFLDPDSDPFEATIVGATVMTGNTVFGGKLIEATGNYDKVLEKAPQERIEKDAE